MDTRSPAPRLPGFRRTLLVAAAVSLPVAGCADASGARAQGDDVTSDEVTAALEMRLDALADAFLDSTYARPAAPIWVDGNGLTEQGRAALASLERAEAEGMDPSRYVLPRIGEVERGDAPSAPDLAQLDIDLTQGLARYANDLAGGLVASTDFDHEWQLDSLDHADIPDAATRGGQAVLDHLDELRPNVEQYGLLQDVLARLREIRDAGGWPRVEAPDTVLEVGDSAAVIAQVRARLEEGMSDEEKRLAGVGRERPDRFDDELGQSLFAFQARHDIEQDGVLGPETIDALNAPVEERIAEVELALERWRWLPADLGSLAVLVNTPERRVHVLRDGKPILSMKSIIGQRDWATALFQDEMEEIVVNPYWNIPESILKSETLPQALEDENFLRDNHYEVVDPETEEVVPLESVDWDEVVLDPVDADSIALEGFPYRIRQKPGDWNALGAVKFMFPNEYAIYLHDTPADHLFDDRLRTFSHGCVRLERPIELAHLLLQEASGRTPAEFDALLATGEEHVLEVDLVPVYLVYQTVWVNEEGAPIFTPDVYDRNAAAREALVAARASSGGGPDAPSTSTGAPRNDTGDETRRPRTRAFAMMPVNGFRTGEARP